MQSPQDITQRHQEKEEDVDFCEESLNLPVCTSATNICAKKHRRRPKSKNGGKSVTFNRRVRFKNIRHIDDFSDREYFATWYVEEDLEAIFNHCVETVTKMVHGEVVLEEEGFSPRGLEYKTPTGSKERRQSKDRGLHIVLEEQESQRLSGIRDPERIAKLYREAGAHSRRACRLLALKDQAEARPILQSKSSVVMLREKQEQAAQHKSTRSSMEELFNRSATSVFEEFNQSVSASNNSKYHDLRSPVTSCPRHRVRFVATGIKPPQGLDI
jgi:hypothetical protein